MIRQVSAGFLWVKIARLFQVIVLGGKGEQRTVNTVSAAEIVRGNVRRKMDYLNVEISAESKVDAFSQRERTVCGQRITRSGPGQEGGVQGQRQQNSSAHWGDINGQPREVKSRLRPRACKLKRSGNPQFY